MGGCEEKSRISWVRWGDVCKLEDKGGLGIKDLRVFNLALVGKWVWRVLNSEEMLWVRILKSRYGDNPFLIGNMRELRGGQGGRALGGASG